MRVEAVSLRNLDKMVRAAGRIEPDERLTYAITPKFEGYVERLHVNATGQAVGKGQPFFRGLQPRAGVGATRICDCRPGGRRLEGRQRGNTERNARTRRSGLTRLRNWDISDEQVKALTRVGHGARTSHFARRWQAS